MRQRLARAKILLKIPNTTLANIICCNGRQHICTYWPTTLYRFQWFCSQTHEEHHAPKMEACLGTSIYADRFDGTQLQANLDECEAWRITVECIKNEKSNCDAFLGVEAAKCTIEYETLYLLYTLSCQTYCNSKLKCT